MGLNIATSVGGVEDEIHDLQFGMWLETSSWKAFRSEKDMEGENISPSCAKALFITKPKNRTKPVQEERVIDLMHKLKSVDL